MCRKCCCLKERRLVQATVTCTLSKPAYTVHIFLGAFAGKDQMYFLSSHAPPTLANAIARFAPRADRPVTNPSQLLLPSQRRASKCDG